MIKKILSVIIPTYNMEDYLSRCLDSLINIPPCILELLEVIVVNDGSKDTSLSIAESYKKKFPKSIFVINKRNGNYGSCVNVGLKECTGKYVRIVDADDWVDSNGLVCLIHKLRMIDVDVVFTSFETVYASGRKNRLHVSNIKVSGRIYTKDSQELLDLKPSEDLAMHRITYKTALLRDIDYKQLEGISYTDLEYDYYPILKAQTFVFYDIILYQYFVGRTGQTISIDVRLKHTEDSLRIIERMLEYPIVMTGPVSSLQRAFLVYAISCYYHMLLVCKKMTPGDRRSLEYLERKLEDFDSDIYMRLNKVCCLGIPYIKIWRRWKLQIINPRIYRFLYETINR